MQTATQAVMFDMDGVVVDSERYWVEREAEDIFPQTVESSVDPADITGMNVVDLYDHLEETYGTTVDRETFVSLYDEVATDLYGQQADLLAGFESLVDSLARREVSLALVSSSPVRWIDRVLDRFDLHGAFDAVVSADHVDHGKPAPDVYLLAAERLGVDPAASLAVEDSRHGVQAARSAGMDCVGYLGAENDAAAVEEATVVADGPGELREVLLARTERPT